jgi:hypothetical protein
MSDSLVEERLTTSDIATPRQARAAERAREENRVDQPDKEPIQLPASNSASAANSAGATPLTDAGPLFPDDELHNFRARWDQVQTSFVDEPRDAVAQADSLVANVVKRIAEQFSAERAALENQWSKGNDVSTEDLRQAFRRYRSFFDRLLTF